MCASPGCARVSDFDLSSNDLDETGSLSSLPISVNRLELHGNAVSPREVNTLLDSTDRPQFDYIGLALSRMSGLRLLRMAQPSRLLSVSRLNLAGNRLTADDLRRLIGDTKTAAIQELNLSGNPLGEAGARVLAGSTALRSLRVLRLRETQLTDAGLQAIVESPYLCQLLALDVGNNPLGDDGFQMLLESPLAYHLRQLVFPGIGISFRTRLALETQFPRDGLMPW